MDTPKTYRVYAFDAQGGMHRTRNIATLDEAEATCEGIAGELSIDCHVITESMAVFLTNKELMAAEGLCDADIRGVIECHAVFAFEAA